MNSSVINSTTFAHDQRSNVAATVSIIADDPLTWQVKQRFIRSDDTFETNPIATRGIRLWRLQRVSVSADLFL